MSKQQQLDALAEMIRRVAADVSDHHDGNYTHTREDLAAQIQATFLELLRSDEGKAVIDERVYKMFDRVLWHKDASGAICAVTLPKESEPNHD